MAFNSASYYRNKWRRDAIAELRKAREHKRQAAAERDANGRQWHLGRLAMAVRMARSSWRLYRSQAVICELQRESRNANRPSRKAKPAYRPEPFKTRESSND